MTIAADPLFPRVSWNAITITAGSNDEIDVSIGGNSETLTVAPGTYRTSGIRPDGGFGLGVVTCLLYALEVAIATHSEMEPGGAYEGETIEVTLDDSGKVRFSSSNIGVGDVIIEWTFPSATDPVDPTWWGFDGTADLTLNAANSGTDTGSLVAKYGWSPNCGTVNGDGIRVPEDVGGIIRPMDGKAYVTLFGEITHVQAVFGWVAAARVLVDFVNVSGYATVAGLAAEDTNAPFRVLWEWLLTNEPVYYRRADRNVEIESLYLDTDSIDMRKYYRLRDGDGGRLYIVDLRLRR